MPDVDNNMDELFRRAAGGYPLKASKDAWDDIAPLLEQSTVPATAKTKKKNIKKYSALLLSAILFLLIAGIVTNYNSNKKASVLVAQSERKIMDKEIKRAGSDIIQQATGVPGKKVADKKQGSIYTIDDVKQKYLSTKNITKLFEKRKYRYNTDSGESGNKESEKLPTVDMPVLVEEIMQKEISNQKILIRKQDLAEYLPNEFVLHQSISPVLMAGKKDGINLEQKALLNKKENIKKQHGIYLGVMFGPSFNQIKTQGLKKPGFDIGIVAGYQINKSLSVETGLMYDRKYYFSSGKYFDMSKVRSSMPADMKVLSLEGNCAVFEIPAKIKYNLGSKGNTNFYSTAGISTYIITNEYNKYRAVTNGTEQNITGAYHTTSRYLAAALDLSLGYQSKISSSGSIRIEPYVQIPLKGIGVGSLPVMTVGLHIGFTHLSH
ncbi:MAG: outer membrane beta-barrel protein [Ferruginibacter sp.]